MFSAAPVTFGEEPNTMINEVDMGMTGTMPVLNKRGVEFAIRVCHALHMEIDELLCFDRKNYYYSDLPKGFQITQDKRPIDLAVLVHRLVIGLDAVRNGLLVFKAVGVDADGIRRVVADLAERLHVVLKGGPVDVFVVERDEDRS